MPYSMARPALTKGHPHILCLASWPATGEFTEAKEAADTLTPQRLNGLAGIGGGTAGVLLLLAPVTEATADVKAHHNTIASAGIKECHSQSVTDG